MIGVVIVTYQSGDVIADCLSSVLNSVDADVRIVVCDNASSDDTVQKVYGTARKFDVDVVEASEPDQLLRNDKSLAKVSLLRSRVNIGFAGAVNLGLQALVNCPAIELFWLLNPDCQADAGAAAAYQRTAASAQNLGMLAGRTLYLAPPNLIQSDGGRVSPWTGVCENIHNGLSANDVSMPAASSFDFVCGANVVASRAFVEGVGLMTEDYFLYYEEVDWAFRRGELEIVSAPEAIVFHHGGTTIGTGSPTRSPSAFANYFNYRNRMRFMWRFNRWRIPIAYAWSSLKIFSMVAKFEWNEAFGAFCGLNKLPPPKNIRMRISKEACQIAFRSTLNSSGRS